MEEIDRGRERERRDMEDGRKAELVKKSILQRFHFPSFTFKKTVKKFFFCQKIELWRNLTLMVLATMFLKVHGCRITREDTMLLLVKNN